MRRTGIGSVIHCCIQVLAATNATERKAETRRTVFLYVTVYVEQLVTSTAQPTRTHERRRRRPPTDTGCKVSNMAPPPVGRGPAWPNGSCAKRCVSD